MNDTLDVVVVSKYTHMVKLFILCESYMSKTWMVCITYLDYIILKKKDERHFRRGGCEQVYTYGQTIHIM